MLISQWEKATPSRFESNKMTESGSAPRFQHVNSLAEILCLQLSTRAPQRSILLRIAFSGRKGSHREYQDFTRRHRSMPAVRHDGAAAEGICQR
jgi:hypothetical protein